MNTTMPVGVSDFKEARENYYLIDKTGFIPAFMKNHKKVTLFTRPRRFGKTLTMSMLEYFFSIDKKEASVDLFTGLAVDRAGEEVMKQQSTYPVIFLTLKNFSARSWKDMYDAIQLLMQQVFSTFSYLLDSAALLPSDKELIQRFLYQKASPSEYANSLQLLSGFLYTHYKVQPIILIDEYDAPLQNAYSQGFYDDAVLFWRGWFNAALKDNPSLHFAVLTGVLRIAKESIFSGMNNLAVYSTLNDTYGDVFGFTSDEVRQMAHDVGREDKIDEIKHWYDGYSFGHTDIYNPWSVICYFDEHCKPAPYWMNTSSNSILTDMLHQADQERIETLQSLMDGKSIPTMMEEGVIYKHIGEDDTALYSMMVNTGYLKAVEVANAVSGMTLYEVRIPNEEIKQVYKREILDNLVQGIRINRFMNFQLALLHGDGEKMNRLLGDILLKMVSFYDTKQPECFYHGLLLGLTCLLEGPVYHVVSNRESGYGRFDMAIFPHKPGLTGVIMEFKVASSVDELEIKAQEGLRQIQDKAYSTEFQKRRIQHIWKYGIAFCGKHVKLVQSI